MRALSLTQPWAMLIVTGRKRVETRSWRAPEALIGQRIAIHASKAMPRDAMELAERWGVDVGELALGAVVGYATFTGQAPTREVVYEVEPEEVEFGDFSPGRWAWFMAHPTAIDPIPASGALGFWNWDAP